MMLVETIGKHVLHEEVELVNGVELLHLVIELLSSESREILVPGIPYVRVLVNVI